MLSGFTWCIPLKTKTAAEVVAAYKNHIAWPSVCIDFKPVPAEQHEIHTLSHKPCLLSSSQTTQVETFPRAISTVKAEPV